MFACSAEFEEALRAVSRAESGLGQPSDELLAARSSEHLDESWRSSSSSSLARTVPEATTSEQQLAACMELGEEQRARETESYAMIA